MQRPSVRFEEDAGVLATGPVPTGSTRSPRPRPQGSRVLLGPAWVACRGARPRAWRPDPGRSPAAAAPEQPVLLCSQLRSRRGQPGQAGPRAHLRQLRSRRGQPGQAGPHAHLRWSLLSTSGLRVMAAKPSSPQEKGGGVLPGSPEDRAPHSPLLSRSPCPPRSARLTLWLLDGFARVRCVSSRSGSARR